METTKKTNLSELEHLIRTELQKINSTEFELTWYQSKDHFELKRGLAIGRTFCDDLNKVLDKLGLTWVVKSAEIGNCIIIIFKSALV